MNLSEKLDSMPPLERFQCLAQEIDRLKGQIKQEAHFRPLDELIDVTPIDELAKRFGTTRESICRRLTKHGGKVFRIGSTKVIRKIQLLDIYQHLEAD